MSLALALGVVLALGFVPACTPSEFGGSGGSFTGANLRGDAGSKRGKGDLSDGDADAPDSGDADSDSDGGDGKDSGGADADGGGGKDSGGSDSGDGKGGGDVDSGDDTGGDTDGTTKNPSADDLQTMDDETKSKYMADGTVTRSEHDEAFTLTVETIYKGETVTTNTLTFGDKGEAKEGTTLKLACRKKKDTCLKLTFKGKIEQVLGASSCTKVLSSDDTSAYVHADTDGQGAIGSCLPKGGTSDDEGIHISCPDAKKLTVENCN